MCKRINLIPMAGAGQRFRDAGYQVPKPLIDIDNRPMIVRAADCLPSADEWVFVCRDFHVNDNAIDRKLGALFNKARIVSVDRLTEGQACTCLLAKEYLRDDCILTIGACDNAMSYNQDAFEQLLDEDSTDAIIWTFRNNPAVLQKPSMYGWVNVDEGNIARSVSCKVPISNDPMNDHAIIGCFTFKKASDFVKYAELMIAQDIRINNEFYVDMVMDVAIEHGLKIRVFEVNQYICWGTPRDLYQYHYWRSYFVNMGLD